MLKGYTMGNFKFSRRMDQFGEEIFASLNTRRLELEKSGKKIYNLSVGTPDFTVSQELMDTLSAEAQNPDNWKYALRDTDEMLEAVVSYYSRRFGVTLEKDMIASCYGSQDGIGHIALALCDEGDTVLLPTPCYPVFIAGSQMAMTDIYYYPMTEETNFLPDVDSIPVEVARKAKYMILSLPSNPMGSVGTPELYGKVIEFARKYDILIIHDNAYSDIIWGGEGRSFLSYPGAMDVGVEFFSLSKSFNLTGARISFLVGRKDIVKAFRTLRTQIDFGMFLPLQKVAVKALSGDLDRVKKQCELYRERSLALCDGLNGIGWKTRYSDGSMFVWVKIPESYKGGSFDFVLELMERAGIVCTPGASFGPLGEGYVRFALVLPPEKIREAVARIDECGILK